MSVRDIESLTVEQLGRELATCVQRIEWLGVQLRAVEELRDAVIMRLRTMPVEGKAEEHDSRKVILRERSL